MSSSNSSPQLIFVNSWLPYWSLNAKNSSSGEMPESGIGRSEIPWRLHADHGRPADQRGLTVLVVVKADDGDFQVQRPREHLGQTVVVHLLLAHGHHQVPRFLGQHGALRTAALVVQPRVVGRGRGEVRESRPVGQPRVQRVHEVQQHQHRGEDEPYEVRPVHVHVVVHRLPVQRQHGARRTVQRSGRGEEDARSTTDGDDSVRACVRASVTAFERELNADDWRRRGRPEKTGTWTKSRLRAHVSRAYRLSDGGVISA